MLEMIIQRLKLSGGIGVDKPNGGEGIKIDLQRMGKI